ncbi:PepSY domain-containing protein [Peribacillus loiseleuriae]|uniref:PepSY domain-containing protein n=1 Tax=Peribacillus loiseleuriae TaxID=1679170 RepID=UPI003D0031D8
MKWMIMVLTSALITGGIEAHTLLDDQTVTKQTNAPSQTINELQAKMIALDISKGGLVTSTHPFEDHGIKKYEISIINREIEYHVDIDAVTGNILDFDQSMKN